MTFKERQQEAREELSEEILFFAVEKKHMLLELPTGVGKTFNALNILKNKKLDKPILVLVPERALIKNFKDDAIKLGFDSLIKGATVICYQSLKKHVDKEFSAVILDEAHRATSNLRIEYLQQIKFDYLIALSATVHDEVEEALKTLVNYEKFSLPLSDAIDRGLVPEPDFRVIEMELDDKLFRNTFLYGKKPVKCTDKDYYQKISNSITYWKDRYDEEGDEWLKTRMLREGSNRIKFLAEKKTEKIREILSGIPQNAKCIVFCGSVDQAIELGGKKTVSSRNKGKTNSTIIKEYNEGKTNRIFARDMLKEGMNLTDTKYGIIGHLNSKERNFIQMAGRLLRDDEPIVYILVFKGTVDERNFNNSTSKVDNSYMSYN